MTSPAVRNDIQIDSACCAAICEEMGAYRPDRRAQPIATAYDDAGRTNGGRPFASAVLSAKSEAAVN